MVKQVVHLAVAASAVLAVTAGTAAQGPVPAFDPDRVFSGSSLDGLETIGTAAWRADGGEIVGTAAAGGSGWLVLDGDYQDVDVFSRFRCTGACNMGVLLRAERRTKPLMSAGKPGP
jgi:hypothetical protein